jgi:hypothetical protein
MNYISHSETLATYTLYYFVVMKVIIIPHLPPPNTLAYTALKFCVLPHADLESSVLCKEGTVYAMVKFVSMEGRHFLLTVSIGKSVIQQQIFGLSYHGYHLYINKRRWLC